MSASVSVSVAPFGREIVIPHVSGAGPVTHVKNVLLQASLSQLQNAGHFERYKNFIDPVIREEILSSLGPSWLPVALADAHYAACDAMQLSDAELTRLGFAVGERLQETTLVSAAKHTRDAQADPWSVIGQLHRMIGRQYRGGSVQVVKVGPKIQLIEMSEMVLTRHGYYRRATLAAIAAVYNAFNVRLESSKIVKYISSRDEMLLRVTWG